MLDSQACQVVILPSDLSLRFATVCDGWHDISTAHAYCTLDILALGHITILYHFYHMQTSARQYTNAREINQ